LKLKIFRGLSIFLTQLPLILFIGAAYDLIFGFNRMDAGFSVLLFLFVFVPVLNLIWTISEIVRSVKLRKKQNRAISYLMPLMAVFFLAESIAVDLYILSQARM